mgnify:CR=1 FL=1
MPARCRCLFSIALGLAVAAPAPAPQPETPARVPSGERTPAESIRQRLESHIHEAGAPGATCALLLPDDSALALAAGVSDRKARTPMAPTDRMLSGSIGKTYCAAIALLLAEQGRLDLDAPISTYLGDMAWFDRLPSARDLTTRMLLNHTAGLREHVTSPDFTAALRDDPDKAWTPEELLAFALDEPALFPAGQGWAYADTNFIVVGLILERLTGRSYNDLLRERLLEPLDLDATEPSDRPDLPGLVPGYTAPDNPFHLPEQTATPGRYWMNPQFEYTGGGTITTSLDLARWARLLYAGDVLTPGSRDQMLNAVPARLGPGVRYGLGTIIWPSSHGDVVGHAGWFPGFVSIVCHYPDLGVTIAYQQNTDVGADLGGLRRLLDDLVELSTGAAVLPPTP